METPYIHSSGALYKFLRNSGGSASMNVDGSTTPVDFSYKCPDNCQAVLSRVLISIFDSGPTGGEFGGIPALTNGIRFATQDQNGKELLAFAEEFNVKQNRAFGLLAGPDWALATGAGVDSVTVRWTFAKAGKEVLLLPGESFVCTVNDNLVAIDDFGMQLQGYFLDLRGNLITAAR